MTACMWILAQTNNAAGGGAANASGAGFMNVILAAGIGMMVWMMLSTRSRQKKEQQEKEKLYSGLTKNDRVLTIGGIIGTVLTVKDREVVLKVDESTNTKMTFLKTAIQRVIQEDAEESNHK